MAVILLLDSVLVPLSLFLIVGYHVNLWCYFKIKPSRITIGIEALRRKEWFMNMKEGDDKKAMLAVQSLRNTLLTTTIAATIAILVELALAALTNNTYNASRIFQSVILEPQSGNGGRIFALKFGSTSFFLLASFFCSALGLGLLIDANFLVSAPEEFSFPAYTQMVFEQGFMMAFIGNRILCMCFPLLLWMFGPLPVALCSVALVWGLYVRDFVGKFSVNEA
ncbi:hypothetical protein Patl1_31558 [Pistacia atlantica]|uniref:Uncharacterized protein n=1 Tax=Pistacia atlantica TaxID=434234 RepID=A0ACC1AMX6_9ROSI|nr:hypothetical protein Patl1_31558 [Pistacia atlantica]